MSQMALQVLVGTALTDRTFCRKLLNGARPFVLADFDLTNEERQAVLAIEAGSIHEFAAQLCEWLEVQDSVPLYPAPAVMMPQVGSGFWQDSLGSSAVQALRPLAGQQGFAE